MHSPILPPEIVEAKEKFKKAQYSYVDFNEADPSNALDAKHMGEIKERLHQAVVDTDEKLRALCNDRGIAYASIW